MEGSTGNRYCRLANGHDEVLDFTAREFKYAYLHKARADSCSSLRARFHEFQHVQGFGGFVLGRGHDAFAVRRDILHQFNCARRMSFSTKYIKVRQAQGPERTTRSTEYLNQSRPQQKVQKVQQKTPKAMKQK